MKKITLKCFQGQSLLPVKGLVAMSALLLMSTQVSWGQQVIGSFGGMDGGFEGQAIGALDVSTTAVTGKWTARDATIITDVVEDATNARSGSKYVNISALTSTNKYLSSPPLVPMITASTSYTIQYYIRSTEAATPGSGLQSHLSTTSGTGGGTATVANYAQNTWVKSATTRNSTSGTPTADNWTGARISNMALDVDDFVLYAGSLDVTAPDAPSGPSVNGLNVSWTAPATGVDGGGYMVVRYATIPNADNDPNVNGIYAKGNTIKNGTGALVGTVVYLGTGTSFTDDVAGSVSGSDYYKIYTVDKAFNYSDEAQTTLGINDLSVANTANVSSNGKIVSVSNISSATTVSVYNTTGSLVKRVDTSSDTSFSLPAGVYVAKVKSSEGEKSVKLLIQ
ncbi:T9SS type A sorting domain-containing protein [Flavobacterium faecale]|uniref:T9SS type A sorting domain-containing protein n=1 Tax=Flavobacterium faecale TaxID=1355330 RepID=UPI003AAB5D81